MTAVRPKTIQHILNIYDIRRYIANSLDEMDLDFSSQVMNIVMTTEGPMGTNMKPRN